LSKLEIIHVFFRRPHPDSDSDLEDPALLPLTRSVLPALKELKLRGNGEYLDDFVVLQLTAFDSSDGPLPTLVQACSSCLLPLSNAQRLHITTRNPYLQSRTILDTRWIDILRLFFAAKSLSLESMPIVPPIAFVLKRVIEEGMTDVLPAIQKLFVSGPLPAGPVREAIQQFVAARGFPAFESLPSLSGGFSAQDSDDE
jgi:hypothetical protein